MRYRGCRLKFNPEFVEWCTLPRERAEGCFAVRGWTPDGRRRSMWEGEAADAARWKDLTMWIAMPYDERPYDESPLSPLHRFRLYLVGHRNPADEPAWSWDGNLVAPSLRPSLRCWASGQGGERVEVWHGFLTDGALLPL